MLVRLLCRLDDEQSVVESLLEMHQSVRRWNPRVLAVDENADADTLKVRTHACLWGIQYSTVIVGGDPKPRR